MGRKERKYNMTEKTKTNADRIREMSDEELAKLLKSGTFICGRLRDVCKDMPGCEECCLVWLRSPANDGGNEK
nr:MAG TPA: hypothetical protein [Caudoviricetes sp.]